MLYVVVFAAGAALGGFAGMALAIWVLAFQNDESEKELLRIRAEERSKWEG